MIAALKQNTVWDYGSTIIAILGISIPSFVFAVLLQYVFAVWLGLFPVGLVGSDGSPVFCHQLH